MVSDYASLYRESDDPRPHPPESGHKHASPILHVSSASTAAPNNNLDDDAHLSLLELLDDDDDDENEDDDEQHKIQSLWAPRRELVN